MSSPISAAPPSYRTLAASQPERVFTARFGLLLAVQLCFGLSFSAFFLLPKFVAVELRGDANAIGGLMSVAALAAVLVAPMVGRWLDRGQRAPFITAGTLATALTAIGFVWVDEIGPLAYALRIAQGVAFSLVFNAAGTFVADIAPRARLGQAIGWFGAAALSTNALAPAGAEWIAHRHGWPTVFVCSAAIGAIACALSLFLREPAPHPESAAPGQADAGVLRGRLGIFYAMAASGAAFGVMFTFTQPFALALGETHVSSLFLGYAASAVFVRVALGGLADRWGRQRVAVGALSLYAVVVAATAALRPGLLPFFGLAFGVAHGMFYPALTAYAVENVGRSRRGSVTTLIGASFNLGQSIVVAICGVLAKFVSYELVFVLAGLLAGCGVIALARPPAARTSA